tara:strand:+ start:137 stop:1555 length:1419 start_codon:yes stop_codon:yes gene_type:complete
MNWNRLNFFLLGFLCRKTDLTVGFLYIQVKPTVSKNVTILVIRTARTMADLSYQQEPSKKRRATSPPMSESLGMPDYLNMEGVEVLVAPMMYVPTKIFRKENTDMVVQVVEELVKSSSIRVVGQENPALPPCIEQTLPLVFQVHLEEKMRSDTSDSLLQKQVEDLETMVAQKDKEIAKLKKLYRNRHTDDRRIIAFKKAEIERHRNMCMDTRPSTVLNRAHDKMVFEQLLQKSSTPLPSQQQVQNMAQEEQDADDIPDQDEDEDDKSKFGTESWVVENNVTDSHDNVTNENVFTHHPFFSGPKCPDTEATFSGGADWTCDRCSCEFESTVERRHCGKCDVDLCTTCCTKPLCTHHKRVCWIPVTETNEDMCCVCLDTTPESVNRAEYMCENITICGTAVCRKHLDDICTQEHAFTVAKDARVCTVCRKRTRNICLTCSAKKVTHCPMKEKCLPTTDNPCKYCVVHVCKDCHS